MFSDDDNDNDKIDAGKMDEGNDCGQNDLSVVGHPNKSSSGQEKPVGSTGHVSKTAQGTTNAATDKNENVDKSSGDYATKDK